MCVVGAEVGDVARLAGQFLITSAYVPSISSLQCEGSFSFVAVAQSPQEKPHLPSC